MKDLYHSVIYKLYCSLASLVVEMGSCEKCKSALQSTLAGTDIIALC